MDFIDRLADEVNTLNLPVPLSIGYLQEVESLVIYPMPGSKTTKTYMDGATDQALNFEFAMKSKSPRKLHDTLWLIQNEIEQLKTLNSNDDSFEFRQIKVTDKPFIGDADNQGWFVFLLNISAEITVLKGDN